MSFNVRPTWHNVSPIANCVAYCAYPWAGLASTPKGAAEYEHPNRQAFPVSSIGYIDCTPSGLLRLRDRRWADWRSSRGPGPVFNLHHGSDFFRSVQSRRWSDGQEG